VSVNHVAIAVRDLPACEAFYTSVLGLPVQRRWPQIKGGDRSVWLDLGGGAFLALERAESLSAGPRPPGPTQGYVLLALTINVGDRAAWETSLAEAGVAVVRRTPYTIYVEDPEGNRIGLSHWPEPAPSTAPQA
jgi:catechol 2,3-dioxygenase-like lactoylglutathione lyase family enzyme